MQFHICEPETICPNYNLELWQSENNIWQVRLDRVAYGCRVHVGRVGGMDFMTEYCAGSNPVWHNALQLAVRQIVSKYPEEIAWSDLRRIWPRWRIRPMFNDLRCWHQLCEMADLPLIFEEAMLKYRYGLPLEELTRHLDDDDTSGGFPA